MPHSEPTPLPPPRPRFSFIPWVVTLAFAIVALWLLTVKNGLTFSNSLLETERDIARVSERIAQSQLEERTLIAEKVIADLATRQQRPSDLGSLKVAILIPNRGQAPDGTIVVVWDPLRRAGLLHAEKLPPLDAGELYQLWIVAADRPPQSVATFESNSPGHISEPFALTDAPPNFTAFLLTKEKSPAPTKPGAQVLGSAGL